MQFTYDFTYYQAEQWVTNRLSQLGALPNGAQPQISPTSPIGEIYRYRVVGPPNYSVTDLKTLEDWVLERRFKAVPGRHRRDRLGRQDQDLRHRDRSAQIDGLRIVGARRCCRRSAMPTSTSAARRSISVLKPPWCAAWG